MAKKKLYLTLVRSQVSYCSPVWRPHLSKDILLLEQVQRRSTKFILNDYHFFFRSPSKLQILPLMYTLELLDVIFCLKSLKSPSTHFNTYSQLYITFATGPIWSSTFNKLEHKLALNNVTRHSYLYRLTRLWNSLPPIDCTLSVSTNKQIIFFFPLFSVSKALFSVL